MQEVQRSLSTGVCCCKHCNKWRPKSYSSAQLPMIIIYAIYSWARHTWVYIVPVMSTSLKMTSQHRQCSTWAVTPASMHWYTRVLNIYMSHWVLSLSGVPLDIKWRHTQYLNLVLLMIICVSLSRPCSSNICASTTTTAIQTLFDLHYNIMLHTCSSHSMHMQPVYHSISLAAQ